MLATELCKPQEIAWFYDLKRYLIECRCKRLDLCWPQWVHFGSQEHHRTSWNPMESYGMSQNLMESHKTLRNLMESRFQRLV
jgi:hypothetical protein